MWQSRTVTSSPTPAGNPLAPNWVGVEIGPGVIRAGVYDGEDRFLGKIKLSAKRERGPAALIARVARCIQYAADECDLGMEAIHAVGIGVPGRVDTDTGRVVVAPGLLWEDISLRSELEKILRLPVFAANIYNLATLGIHRRELGGRPRTFAALFPGSRIGGGLMENGSWLDPALLHPGDEPPTPGQENILAVMPGDQFQEFRGKDFKKALRKGNKAVEQYVRAMAARTGEVAAGIMDRFHPETIAIGGGVMEEMREDLMEIIECAAFKRAAPGAGARTQFVASTLGDYAPLAGGAAWAAQQSSRRESRL